MNRHLNPDFYCPDGLVHDVTVIFAVTCDACDWREVTAWYSCDRCDLEWGAGDSLAYAAWTVTCADIVSED